MLMSSEVSKADLKIVVTALQTITLKVHRGTLILLMLMFIT